MKTVTLLMLTLASAPIAASGPTSVRLGGLETEYDASVITVERFDGGVVVDDGRPWSRTAAYVEVTEAGGCTPEAMRTALGERRHSRSESGSRTLASGLTLNWATTWTGCRALTGRPIAACIQHDGVTTLVRGLDLGCRTPVAQDVLILALLEGARPAGEAG